jgi:hypothetical protein
MIGVFRRIILWVSLAGCGVIATTSCGSGDAKQLAPRIDGSSKSYRSIEALAERADVVAVGYAGGVTERFEDNGNDPANPPLPGLFQSFRIEKVVKAGADITSGSEVSLALLNTDKVRSESDVRLEPESRLLLFLYKASGPINGTQRAALVPISSDNGIFDVSGDGVVKPRSSRVRAISEPDARAELNALAKSSNPEDAKRQTEIKTFRLTDIQAFIANSQ